MLPNVSHVMDLDPEILPNYTALKVKTNISKENLYKIKFWDIEKTVCLDGEINQGA